MACLRLLFTTGFILLPLAVICCIVRFHADSVWGGVKGVGRENAEAGSSKDSGERFMPCEKLLVLNLLGTMLSLHSQVKRHDSHDLHRRRRRRPRSENIRYIDAFSTHTHTATISIMRKEHSEHLEPGWKDLVLEAGNSSADRAQHVSLPYVISYCRLMYSLGWKGLTIPFE